MVRALLVIVVVLAAALQAILPVFAWLGGVRPELLPGLVAYFALTLKRPAHVVGLASLAGLAQDSLSAAPFGLTMATFVAGALTLWALRGLLDRDFPWVQLAAGAWVSALSSAVAVLVIGVTVVAVVKVVWLAVLNAMATAVVFFVMDFARMQMGVEE